MTVILSEQTKQEFLTLAGNLNDLANDIHRQVRIGKVFANDLDTWMKIKKILCEE